MNCNQYDDITETILLSLDEVAEHLDISIDEVREMVDLGNFPTTTINRVPYLSNRHIAQIRLMNLIKDKTEIIAAVVAFMREVRLVYTRQ